jgi:hypothetical protein
VQGGVAVGGWYRVFGRNEVQPEPAELVEQLHAEGLTVRPAFRGDDLGWFSAMLTLADGSGVVELERFLTREEGIRGELNAWAAWLETVADDPNGTTLMERVIQTKQLFTIRAAELTDPARVGVVCVAVSRFLARVTDGIYQVDGQGFFTAEGAPLLREA